MPAQVSGEVYLDHNFVFPDNGKTAPKYIVVLCESIADPDNVITVRTTSQQHQKSNEIGCHQTLYPSPYYSLGVVDEIFREPKPTWLMFDYVQEYNYSKISNLKYCGILDDKVTAEILCCVSHNEGGKLYNFVIKSVFNQIELFKTSGIIKI